MGVGDQKMKTKTKPMPSHIQMIRNQMSLDITKVTLETSQENICQILKGNDQHRTPSLQTNRESSVRVEGSYFTQVKPHQPIIHAPMERKCFISKYIKVSMECRKWELPKLRDIKEIPGGMGEGDPRITVLSIQATKPYSSKVAQGTSL